MTRRIVVNFTLSLDGRITGPGGNEDMGWVVPHVLTDAVRNSLDASISTATTALMGSVNADGYRAVWPAVADDPEADPRDRAFSRWLSAADKVVLSSRRTTPWPDARVFDLDVVALVEQLRREPGGDILVLNSVSATLPLLRADLVDELALVVVPEILGAGRVLFEEAVPASSWELRRHAVSETGACAQTLVRKR